MMKVDAPFFRKVNIFVQNRSFLKKTQTIQISAYQMRLFGLTLVETYFNHAGVGLVCVKKP